MGARQGQPTPLIGLARSSLPLAGAHVRCARAAPTNFASNQARWRERAKFASSPATHRG